jgi:hypothetical protein
MSENFLRDGERLVCVRCGGEVRRPARKGVGGVSTHVGHVDLSRNETCGWWGYRVAKDDEATP